MVSLGKRVGELRRRVCTHRSRAKHQHPPSPLMIGSPGGNYGIHLQTLVYHARNPSLQQRPPAVALRVAVSFPITTIYLGRHLRSANDRRRKSHGFMMMPVSIASKSRVRGALRLRSFNRAWQREMERRGKLIRMGHLSPGIPFAGLGLLYYTTTTTLLYGNFTTVSISIDPVYMNKNIPSLAITISQ